MKDVLEEIDAWTARGDKVALATVIDVKRSAPRPPGAKMAINEHGEIAGAVSGGCVEGAVVVEAEEVLNGGAPRLLITFEQVEPWGRPAAAEGVELLWVRVGVGNGGSRPALGCAGRMTGCARRSSAA